MSCLKGFKAEERDKEISVKKETQAGVKVKIYPRIRMFWMLQFAYTQNSAAFTGIIISARSSDKWNKRKNETGIHTYIIKIAHKLTQTQQKYQ